MKSKEMPQFEGKHKNGSDTPPTFRLTPENNADNDANNRDEGMSGLTTTGASTSSDALREIESKYQQLIHGLPAAIYTCDANGYILTYNKAAVELWGREPEAGKDRWCGSWKIYTAEGVPMPLEQSPLAIALKEGKDVTDVEIIVERPDGQKRIIMPCAKPLFNDSGKVIGAVNTLVDITDRKLIEERNGHFAAIIQSSDDAIISKTLDGIVTSWNNSAERIFGYTAEEMIGEHITKIVPPDRLDEEFQIRERLEKGERIDHFETKRITKDGVLLNISLSISPIKNNKGIITGASKIARDITAQKKAERQIRENEELIRESEERLRLAVEIAELGTWELDLATGLTATSTEHRKILGYSKEEQWGKQKFMNILHPADQARVQQAFETALQTGKISYEARIIRPDNNQQRWIRVNGTTIYDKKHTPVKMLGTVLDITDQKKAKEDLERMVLARTSELLTSNSALEKSNHELEQFAYIASHDLQEPLRKIQTFADMAKDHLQGNEMAEKYFQKIYSSANRMSRLINDVLNYSRLTKTGEQFINTDLNKVLKDVLSDFELLIEQKQAVITSTDLPTIKGIPLQLHQLMANLISNSLKFTEEKPVISITAKQLTPREVRQYPALHLDNEYVQLVFADNGIGFEQQYAEQIFIIFQRLNNQRTYSGTGIGLALCKKIVDHHDGIIMAQSAIGQGATFTVILPVYH
ncbi:PAS domain-containing sensor histidine kinase [Longitalea arenae]|uniref:PAS domain-containing sensor histidine kinase n=1 Tax=Longitalea arenae TaxID=2812558 RepID=UPI0019673A81|nr:PAS domain S-box protein [Longitalea arenae]